MLKTSFSRVSSSLIVLGSLFTAGLAQANCDLKAKVNIRNSTGHTMQLLSSDSDLTWGKWDSTPLDLIPNGDTGSFTASGACGSATGTQGQVKYAVLDSEGVEIVTIGWDVPWGVGATNTCSTYDSDRYEVTLKNNNGSSDCGGDAKILVMNARVLDK